MTHLVYFSPVSWASFAQRPHRFVEWWQARHGANVLWIDPYATRFPASSDLRRLYTDPQTITGPAPLKQPHWLTVLHPPALPIEPLPGSAIINRLLWCNTVRTIDSFIGTGDCVITIGKPSELALQVLCRYPQVSSLFDVMDNFPAFYGGLSRRAMARNTARVAAHARRIVVSSTDLAMRFSAYRSKLSIVHNACSVDALSSPVTRAGEAARAIFGYVGAIGHWFDWALVLSLATAYPAALIRLIGPLYCRPPASLPHNIELLPACDNETALRSMEEFFIGLIPFKQTELTAAVDPIKYYEYRASGLPVLSTVFGEMALRKEQPGVFLMDGEACLSSAVDCAMAYEAEPDELCSFRARNSWAARFDAGCILA